MSRILPVFAGRPKRLRVDCAKSHQAPTPRRGFLATVVAGLGLAARPAVASEWIVEPDDAPGPLMRAWRAVQQAQANYDSRTDFGDEAGGALNERVNEAVAELVDRIAEAAGYDLDAHDRSVDPGTAAEVPGLAAVREGDALFTLVFSSRCTNAKIWGNQGTCCIQPAVFEGFFAGRGPRRATGPRGSSGLSMEDVQLAAAVDRYLAAVALMEASWAEVDRLTRYEDNGLLATAWDKANRDLDATNDAGLHLAKLLVATTLINPPLSDSGRYTEATPVYSRRVGGRLVMLCLVDGASGCRVPPLKDLHLTIADLD